MHQQENGPPAASLILLELEVHVIADYQKQESRRDRTMPSAQYNRNYDRIFGIQPEERN